MLPSFSIFFAVNMAPFMTNCSMMAATASSAFNHTNTEFSLSFLIRVGVHRKIILLEFVLDKGIF